MKPLDDYTDECNDVTSPASSATDTRVHRRGQGRSRRARRDENCVSREHGTADTGTRTTRGAANQRVWNLLNKGEVFREFATNAVALELIRHLLGPDILLFSTTANIARRGGQPQPLHGDQLFAPADIPHPLLANCLWMLDEFTDENGATRVVPNSHRFGRWPLPEERIDTVPATGACGTLMVWEGRLWHGTGVNTTDAPRHGLLNAFCRAFLRTQENHTVSVAPDVLEQCSPELLTLLGFSPWRSLGMIDGGLTQMRNGRPTSYSTPLDANGQRV